MSTTTNNPGNTGSLDRTGGRTWRTVDVVVAAVVAVAVGVVFAGWNAIWGALTPAFTFFPPAQGILYGIWMIGGPLGMLIVRKPGAALFTEVVAALVSMLFGGWGLPILIWGFFQGLLAESVFFATGYKRFSWHIAALAGASAGLIAAILDLAFYYSEYAAGWKLVYGVLVITSSLIIAGLGSFALVKSLRRTGVLSPFASGRS